MTRSRRALLVLAATVAACTPAMVGSPAADQAAIRARSADFLRAAQTNDVNTIVGFHAPNAVASFPNAAPAVGTAQIRGTWTGFLGSPGLRINWRPTSVNVAASGDLATESGTYELSFNAPTGRIEDRGNYTTTWRKIDGQWLVVNDIVTSSIPLPAPVNVTFMFDTASGMTRHAAAETRWTNLVVPGFPPGARLSVIHGDPFGEGDYALRLWFPAGYEFPVHWHPKAEHLTVLSGSFQLAMGDAVDRTRLVTYGAGDFLYLPGRMAHFGGAPTESVIQLHGIGPFAINVGPSPR